MNSGTFSGFTSYCPLGLLISLAIFATSLFGPTPAEAVNFVSLKIKSRISLASGPGGREFAVTSR